MNIVTLAEIKAHTRIDSNAEDTMLTLYGDSAEEVVLSILDRDLDDIVDEYGSIPKAIKHAVLMLVDHSYAQRSPASVQQLYAVPYTIEACVKPYMNL